MTTTDTMAATTPRGRVELLAELERALSTARRTLAELEKLVVGVRSAAARADELVLEHDRRELVRLLEKLGYVVVDAGEDTATGRSWAEVDWPRSARATSVSRDPALAAAGVYLERLRFTLEGFTVAK